MVNISLFLRCCLFFVEPIYAQVVSYNRLRGKDTSDELSDIKLKQGFVLWMMMAMLSALVGMCCRYLFHVSLNGTWFVVVCFALGILGACFAARKINELGLYESALKDVMGMDTDNLKKRYKRAEFLLFVRVCVSPLFLFLGHLLLSRLCA